MSFPRATEMFQFTRFASHDYVFIMRYLCRWVSPFGNLRIKAYLPAPRSLSQAITSFVAYHCQGIHHMLLVTWPYNFDTSYEIKIVSRTDLTGLSPVALCRNVNNSKNITTNQDDNILENNSSLLNLQNVFQHNWIFVLTQSKNVIRGTVCTKPLRMCSFPWQR